jgi:hypothetical protein
MSTENLVEKTESAEQTAGVADVATEENLISIMLKAKATSLEAIGKAVPPAKKAEKESAFNLASKLAAVANNEESRFKDLMQALGLYKIDGNEAEIAKLEKDIATAKEVLIKAGFSEDSEIVRGATKGLTAELERTRKATKDNLADLANYFGVKLASKHLPHASTGELAMKRYSAADIQKNDWLIQDGEKTMVVVHSSTLSDEVLAPYNIKPASENYIGFIYNGDLQFTRVTTNIPGESEKIAKVTNWPTTFLEVKPIKFELDSLSGFEKACLLALRGLKPTDEAAQKIARNGWQANSKIDGQAKLGIKRVVRVYG